MRRNYESSVGTEAALVFDNPIVTGINFLHKNPKELVNFVSCQEDPIGCLRVTWHNETTRENLKDRIKEAATWVHFDPKKIENMVNVQVPGEIHQRALERALDAFWETDSTSPITRTRVLRSSRPTLTISYASYLPYANPTEKGRKSSKEKR